MTTPRECIEDCTAMSKASLGRTSPCLLSWETPSGFQNVAIWPSVPTVITMQENGTLKSSLPPSCSARIQIESKRSFAMSLPMPQSSMLGSMSYAKWQNSMEKPCPEVRKDEQIESRKSFGAIPFTTTRFSSKPSPEGPDHDPDTWGLEETP